MADDETSSHPPLPQTQFHILVALTAGESHGYVIRGAVEESADGVVRMGPSSPT